LLTLFLLVIIAVVVIVVKCSNGGTEVKVDDPMATEQVVGVDQNVQQTNAQIQVNAEYFDNAVFLGNALAEGIDVYGLLPYTDFYSGVGITLENVYTSSSGGSVSMVDRLKSQKFSKVYLSFGETELTWEDATEFSSQYAALIDDVKEYQPSANIYIISIPPVSENSTLSVNGVNLRNIKAYNKALKALAARKKVYFVDSFDAVGEDYLPDNVSSDGVNLNEYYCAQLINYAQKNAYIPSVTDLNTDNTDNTGNTEDTKETDETKETETVVTEAPTAAAASGKTAESTEAPTTNVLKDNASAY
jgi:hypothetical protein